MSPEAGPLGVPRPARVRIAVAANAVAAVWYFAWLLHPDRIGNPWLYALLLAAEAFNLVQAAGFWWTVLHDRGQQQPSPKPMPTSRVDVLVPRYDEPEDVVGPVLQAAAAMRGATVTVYLLDDGDSLEMELLAAQCGVRYLTREHHEGAKAGNINAALARTDGEFVVVFDCDHVPHPDFLVRTLGHLSDPRTAFVQTPQYYTNADRNPVAAAASSQQALFFGSIARGKAALGAMFCCGTNVVFRRAALESVGGFPERSLTEDFELSINLQERGWRTAYVPEVLAHGLGPQDMAGYVSQQLRWARGCLSALGRLARATLPLRVKAQYLLSSLYFLSGWTALIYMSLPVVRILTGEQPVAAATADAFLLHFAPYFALALTTVAVAGAGTYRFAAFAVATASFWIHVTAALMTLARRRGSFVVTPKTGSGSWQPLSVWPALLAMLVLLLSAAWGLARSQDAGMVNNVAFAVMHLSVLGTGVAWALRPAALARRAAAGLPQGDSRWRSTVDHHGIAAVKGAPSREPVPAP